MATLTVPQAFDLALQQHRAGRFAEAEALYRQILVAMPRHADALHGLGVLAHQMGHNDAAIATILQAIAIAPAVAEFHSNLGEVYRAQGRLDEAIAAYRRTLQLKPELPEAHNNLGNALRDQGRLDEAGAACRQAIQLRNDYPEAHNNLANVLKDQGRLDEAMAFYRRAIALKPDYAEAFGNLGNALCENGQIDEAVAACRQAIGLRENYAKAHNNLGNALRLQGHLAGATAAYQRAIELQPEYAEAYSNLGNALVEKGHLDEALSACRRALDLNPGLPDAHNNLGVILGHHGHLPEAIAAHRRALELKPNFAEAHSNLLLTLHYASWPDARSIFEEHRQWERMHAGSLRERIAPHDNERDPERRLRLGYVSPDFRGHSVACFLETVLEQHDRSAVEVFCYADLLREDEVTARLRGHAEHWRTITGLTDDRAAALIRRDGIDILVDLAGHTANHRLRVFARKPAAVQITWLGYPDTTGLAAMDYRLTDAHADPPGTTENLHIEKLVRLPQCAWCFQAPRQSPSVVPPPVLRTSHITFGCFNARPKMNDEVLGLWARLLLAVPGSRLLLKNLGFGDSSVRGRTLSLLAAAGVEPARVEMLGRIPSAAEHLATYSRVDIALDTFPYHGTTTTCEALWMGVPVVTLAGATHVSRVGVSLLRNAGLPDFVTNSPEEYIHVATKLAEDVDRLSELRASLRARLAASPLMDAPRFARHIEHAYRQMWRAWCAQPSSHPTS